MFQSYFSKAAIARLEPAIQEKVSTFVAHLCESARTDKVVDLSYAFRCLTLDIITTYCFQKSFDSMDAPDFKDPTIEAFMTLAGSQRIGKYFPWIEAPAFKLVNFLSPKNLRALSPELGYVKGLLDVSVQIPLHYWSLA